MRAKRAEGGICMLFAQIVSDEPPPENPPPPPKLPPSDPPPPPPPKSQLDVDGGGAGSVRRRTSSASVDGRKTIGDGPPRARRREPTNRMNSTMMTRRTKSGIATLKTLGP